jgi:RND family efflux transporter MFP subunit
MMIPKKHVIAKSFLIVALGIGLTFTFTGCTFLGLTISGSNSSATTKKISTGKVTKGDLTVGLVEDGRISRSFTNLSFSVGGTIKTVNVQVGQSVKSGDVLASLDDTTLKQTVTTIQSQLDMDTAQYNAAVDAHKLNVLNEQNKLNNSTNTYNANPTDQTKAALDLETQTYNNLVNYDQSVIKAQAQVTTDQNNLKAAQENLSNVVLKAPSDGVITTISNKVGETITVSSGNGNGASGSSSTFMVLEDPNVINVSSSVTEGDISGITNGQTMVMSIDALSLNNIMGTVSTVSSKGSVDTSGIVTYTVTGTLNSPNADIKDGMTCSITFLKKQLKNVLMVPTKAVFIENGKQYVKVQQTSGGKTTVVKKAVTCGISNGTATEVSDGLTEGQTVILGSVIK